MLIHTLLFLGLRIYLARTAKLQPVAEPIAVEFVEPSESIAASASTATGSVAAPNTTTSAAPSAAEPDLPFPPAEPEASVPAPSAIEPGPTASQFPEGGIAQAPPAAPPIRDVPEPLPSPVPTEQPPVEPVPRPADTPTPSQPAPRSDGNTGTPADQPGEASSDEENRLPAPPPTAPPGDSAAGGGSDGGNSDLPGVSVSPGRGEGTGVQLAVTALAQADVGRDVTDRLPQQPLPTLSLPERVYPSGVGLNFGTPVTIRVLLNRQGKPQQIIRVVQSSASEDYDQLAQELLLQAQFPPIVQSERQGQGVEQTVDVTLTLNPINR